MIDEDSEQIGKAIVNAPYLLSILLSLGLVASCAPTGTRPPSNPAQSVAFSCPAEGVQSRRIGSSTLVTYGKADPSDPTICAAVVGNQPEGRWLYNWFKLPVSNEQQKRNALANAFKGGPEYCYTEISKPSNSTGYTADVNASYIYEHCWEQVGQKAIVIKGKTYNTIAIRDTEEGRAGNSFAVDRTIYYDIDSKIVLRVDASTRRGTAIRGYENEVIK